MTPSAPSGEQARLHNLLDEAWDFEMEESPLTATVAGDHRFDDRLPPVGAEHEARRAQYREQTLARLGDIDRAKLDTRDRTSYDMFRLQLEDALSAFRFQEYLIPLTNRGGFHVGFAELPRKAPLLTAQDYENYVARLKAFPLYADQHIALLRQGLERGMVLPRAVLDGYELSIEAHVVDDVRDSLFYVPFKAFPPGVPEAERSGLAEQGRISIMESTVPAYRAFLEFIVEEYLPGCRPTVGASHLPDGKSYYEYLVHHFTTLDTSPEEVHQTGLDEVKRLRAEMEEVVERVGFEGDFSAFLTFLRTDARFYVTEPEELLKEAAYIQKRMDGLLPRLFGRLPRLPYGI